MKQTFEQQVLARRERKRLEASLQLKARSALRRPKNLDLDTKQLNSEFLGFFNGKYKTQTSLVMARLILTQLAPAIVTPILLDNQRTVKAAMAWMLRGIPSTLIELTKGSDSFVATIPLLQMPISTSVITDIALSLFKGKNLPELYTQVEQQLRQYVMKPEAIDLSQDAATLAVNTKDLNLQQAIADASTGDPALRTVLGQTLRKLELRSAGGVFMVYGTFEISKAQAQYMANKAWITIRPMDIYPLLRNWVEHQYGITGRVPMSAFSVSSIASTLPTDTAKVTPKVNDDSITCDREGKPLYIPRVVDKTREYEDLYSQAGATGSGTFALTTFADFAANKARVRLPANIPVLVDWVNNRFSYTNTNGELQVQNLSACRQATPVHINTWLGFAVTIDNIKRLSRMGEAVGVSPTISVTAKDFTGFTLGELPEITEEQAEILVSRMNGKTPEQFYEQALNVHLRYSGSTEIFWRDVAANSQYTYLRPLGRYLSIVADVCLSSLDNLYAKYSISYTTHVLPWAILASKYAPNESKISAEASAITRPAAEQGVDPEWKRGPVELWNPDLGTLPHQTRIGNLLRESPDFAILPVEAGGGKTPLIILDLLQEYQAGRSHPYLIMCPSHLVAQYAKEINFFTKGRLNVIPVNSKVMRFQGSERMTKLIQNAPRNTVVVADYDALKINGESICYGTTLVNVFPVVEVLKQFSFGIVWLDESHYLKGGTSARSRSVMGLITDIPKKRLASGTMAHDSPSDIAAQIAQLDPTLFGTRDEFNERFGAEVKGGRVVQWRPGAQAEIDSLIKSRVVVCRAQRKEWAALLPPIKEAIIPCKMSPAQQIVYNMIFAKTMEELEKDKQALDALSDGDATDAEDIRSEDDNIGISVTRHFARLEQFVAAPAEDELGRQHLSGADLVSPKVNVIVERIREHLSQGIPGKILIFTSYVSSAEQIYQNFPSDIKAQCILYYAGEKVDAGAAFEFDPKYKVMIGVEHSMNTGLNFQFVSRLIRVDAPWTPGALEQGNARLNRPEFKKQENRAFIYFDWITCDESVDVTKVARLTSKIVAVAKFDNATNPEYQELPDLPLIRMNVDTIKKVNNWGILSDYAGAYRDYRRVVISEYAEYKREFDAQYGTEYWSFPGQAATSEDAEFMPDSPYAQGTEIAFQKELGLIRVDQYLRMDESSDDLEELKEAGTLKEDASKSSQINALLRGRRVHTDLGDGVIRSVSVYAKNFVIDLDNGTVGRTPWSASFLIDKDLPKGMKSVSQAQAAAAEITLGSKVDVLSAIEKRLTTNRKPSKAQLVREQREQAKKERELRAAMKVTLNFVVSNGFVGLSVDEETTSTEVLQTLQGWGFRPVPQYRRAWIKNHRMLQNQMQLWADKGFMPHKDFEVQHEIMSLFTLLHSGKIKQGIAVWKYANANELRNFYRMEVKPDADKNALKLYPVIEDGKAYIALPMRGQAGNKRAVMFKAPGVVWAEAAPAYSWFATRPQAVKHMVERIYKSGIKITNAAKLKEQYKLLQKQKIRENIFFTDVDNKD